MWLGIVLASLLMERSQPLRLLVRQAQEDLAAGRYVDAQKEIQNGLRTAPDSSDLWFYLGVAELHLSHFDPARTAFQKSLALNPKRAAGCFNLGLIYLHVGDSQRALEAYQKGLVLDPNNLAGNQNYALLLMRAGRFRDAVEPLLKLKQMDSSNISFRVSLMEAYMNGGMRAAAEAELNELLEPASPSWDKDLKLARALIDLQLTDLAHEVLQRAVNGNPGSPEAHAEFGFLLLQERHYEEAVQHLGTAAQLVPESAIYSLGTAKALLSWKHTQTALELLTAIRDRFGSLPEYRYLVAVGHYDAGLLPQAIRELERLGREHPEMDRVQFDLGNWYLRLGDLEKANEFYKRALALRPGEPLYYAALADVVRRRSPDKLARPIQLLEKALALHPSDVLSGFELALCYEAEGKVEKAEALSQRVVREAPDFAPAHMVLARIYYRHGKRDQAEQEELIVARLRARGQPELDQSDGRNGYHK
jgi:tetratricopeptide (TPR) repeat protein